MRYAIPDAATEGFPLFSFSLSLQADADGFHLGPASHTSTCAAQSLPVISACYEYTHYAFVRTLSLSPPPAMC